MIFMHPPQVAVRKPYTGEVLFTFKAQIDDDYGLLEEDIATYIKRKMDLSGKVKMSWMVYGQYGTISHDGIVISTIKVD